MHICGWHSNLSDNKKPGGKYETEINDNFTKNCGRNNSGSGWDAVRVNGLITVNEVGALICEQLKEERTVDALVAAVTAQFDVDAQTARTDIASFIHTLEENDLLA